MTDASVPALPANQIVRKDRVGDATIVGVALVVLADLLIYRQAPGLGLFTFVLAIAVGLLIVWRRNLGGWRTPLAALFFLATALPLLEASSLLAALSFTIGLTGLAIVASRHLPERWTHWPMSLLRFVVCVPLALIGDVLNAIRTTRGTGLVQRFLRGVVVWLVPLVCAGVFLLLFAQANPLIESVLSSIDPFVFLEGMDVWHGMFWFLVAAWVWPFLLPRLAPAWSGLARPVTEPPSVENAPAEGDPAARAPRENLLFGHAAILRSLIVFNALFAVQTGLDLFYLWGGAALPNGMSYASYAHRGAYPLILTALLAAAFVLAAMRRGGPGESSKAIRLLVYAWIAQNVLLVVSSMVRLGLYVEVYSLTELRIAAGIWMGLVAVGLLLILARIAFAKSNSWLVASNAAALFATLFVCAFVNFPDVIARFNVEHSPQMGGGGAELDLYYLTRLGPQVIPAFDLLLPAARDPQEIQRLRDWLANEFLARDRDWRDWTFRDARLEDYLAAHPPRTTPERPDLTWSMD